MLLLMMICRLDAAGGPVALPPLCTGAQAQVHKIAQLVLCYFAAAAVAIPSLLLMLLFLSHLSGSTSCVSQSEACGSLGSHTMQT
jgi:hypothetical protein